MSKTPSKTIISKNSIFKGTLQLKDHLEICGTFEGEINTNQDVTISENGFAKTNIHAENVQVAGKLIGEIVASKSVSIKATGKVEGNITSPNLDIETGASTTGKVEINKTSK